MGTYDHLYAGLPVWAQHAAVTTYGVYWPWLRFGPGYRRYVREYRYRQHLGAAPSNLCATAYASDSTARRRARAVVPRALGRLGEAGRARRRAERLAVAGQSSAARGRAGVRAGRCTRWTAARVP